MPDSSSNSSKAILKSSEVITLPFTKIFYRQLANQPMALSSCKMSSLCWLNSKKGIKFRKQLPISMKGLHKAPLLFLFIAQATREGGFYMFFQR